MEIYCEVCECNIWKCGWVKRVKTQKHRIACGDVVVEEVLQATPEVQLL